MTDAGGLRNILQGDFGETLLEAVASGLGLTHGRPASTDLDKADVQLTRPGSHWGTYSPTVKAQVKTVTSLRSSDTGFVYDLDTKSYDVLRRTDHAVRRVLAVVHLRDDDRRIQVTDEGTLLLGLGYWVSLEGLPESDNKASVAVTVPEQNRLDEEGLMRMLQLYGVRISTVVPAVDPWTVER